MAIIISKFFISLRTIIKYSHINSLLIYPNIEINTSNLSLFYKKKAPKRRKILNKNHPINLLKILTTSKIQNP